LQSREIDDAITHLQDLTQSEWTERNDKLDVLIFDQLLGYVEDKQKYIEAAKANIQVGADFYKPVIELAKKRQIIAGFDDRFRNVNGRHPFCNKKTFSNILAGELHREYLDFEPYVLEEVADQYLETKTGADGRTNELVRWQDFISSLKRRLEISKDIDHIFINSFDWMQFCGLDTNFKELFGRNSEDIDWLTFRDSI